MLSLNDMTTNSKVKEVRISWKGLSANVKDKAILSNCDGYCQPGEMLAIMGPSGAGKTTLLSLISQRNNPTLNVKGEILANSLPFSQKSFYNFGAFVYQNDLLHEVLTVRETLEFAAKLKIPNKEVAFKTVTDLLTSFELQKCENTYVGGRIIKGISGGEKKRVCIAIEMVSRPSVLILDQPTSGLDSNKAAKVLSILKKLTTSGHTVIFTLHQPSYLQYIKLDRLILLNRGGTVYQGQASQIHLYMERVGIKVQKSATISDFFMLEISQSKRLTEEYESPLNVENYSIHLQKEVTDRIKQINEEGGDLQFTNVYIASSLLSFYLLLKRDWTIFWRDKMKFGSAILNTIMRFLLVGILFMNAIPSRQELATNPQLLFIGIQGIAFNCVASSVFPSVFAVSLAIPAERQLYIKETDSKKYSPLPYFLSKLIISFFGSELSAFLYCAAGYWLNGWTNQFPYFINFVLIITLLTATGNSLGFFCATLFKEPGRVSALTNIVVLPLFILSGLFNKLTSMPVWISWLQYVSPFRYGLHLFMLNQYGEEVFGTYDYREKLGFTLNYTVNFLVLTGITLAFYTLSFLFLKFKKDKIVA